MINSNKKSEDLYLESLMKNFTEKFPRGTWVSYDKEYGIIATGKFESDILEKTTKFYNDHVVKPHKLYVVCVGEEHGVHPATIGIVQR